MGWWRRQVMITALRELPIEQRLQLVEDHWDSIATDQQALPLTEWRRVELDRRLDAYEVDGDRGGAALLVIADIRQRR
jgi:putative addiction module component (TIGR02574 family)